METLESYGVDISKNSVVRDIHNQSRAIVPKEHIEFLNSLKYSFQEGELFFVHAGIRPGVPIAQQNKDDLLWIRNEFHEYTEPHPLLIVHGHTPVDAARHYGNRVNLDTGSGYGDSLTTAVFEGKRCWLLTDSGRFELSVNPLK